MPYLGAVSFDRNGWQRGRNWHRAPLAEGLSGEFSEGYTGPGGDVDFLNIKVTAEKTGEVLLNQRMIDPTTLNIN
jgi:hypothetical protein